MSGKTIGFSYWVYELDLVTKCIKRYNCTLHYFLCFLDFGDGSIALLADSYADLFDEKGLDPYSIEAEWAVLKKVVYSKVRYVLLVTPLNVRFTH